MPITNDFDVFINRALKYKKNRQGLKHLPCYDIMEKIGKEYETIKYRNKILKDLTYEIDIMFLDQCFGCYELFKRQIKMIKYDKKSYMGAWNSQLKLKPYMSKDWKQDRLDWVDKYGSDSSDDEE